MTLYEKQQWDRRVEESQAILDKNKHVSLDLGCGRWKNKNFVGIDIMAGEGVDIVHDLEKTPWPLPDECADLISASHLVEHINPANFGFIKFMNEAWRVLKPGATIMIAHPYAGSPGYWQDPTHINGCNEATWTYFDPMYREGYLYAIYEPAPWKILDCTYKPEGNLEIALEKRQDDRSYHYDKEVHYGK